MAGYRNRMEHLYHEVTDKELFTITRNNLSDIENFVLQIKEFLKKYNKQKTSLK